MLQMPRPSFTPWLSLRLSLLLGMSLCLTIAFAPQAWSDAQQALRQSEESDVQIELGDLETPPTESAESETTDEPAEADSDDPSTYNPLYIRVRSEDSNPVAMETAIGTYTGGTEESPLVVDLIGAVHIADMAYYEELNELFTTYDVLLYELVAERDSRPNPEERGFSLMRMFQEGAGNLLDLSFQLDGVDYSCENFVHADMSPEEFAESAAARDQGWAQMYFQEMGYSLAANSATDGAGQVGDFELLAAMFAPDRAIRLKRMMAEMLISEDAHSIGNGSDTETAIITDRNRVALDVLTEQIEAGHTRIGIFYGAAHMDEFDQKLLEEFNLTRGPQQWITAWDLQASEEEAEAEEELEEATAE